jgi:hypothetical protein
MLNCPKVALDIMNRGHTEFVTMHRQLPGPVSSQVAESGADTLLDDWFINRVNNMDFVTAGFIQALGGERT